MKQWKQMIVAGFSLCAVLVYFNSSFHHVQTPVVSDSESVNLEIVLKDDQDHLIPLTIQSDCIDEIGCLNAALKVMSESHNELYAVIPHHAQIISMECADACMINFTKEILEFEPAKRFQVEYALSTLFKEYDRVEFMIEGKKTQGLQLHKDAVNPVHFVEKDYTKGILYQMFRTKEINGYHLLVPVMIYASTSDVISVIENFYTMNASVQFDNVNFQHVQIEEGEPMRVHFSSECMKNQELMSDSVLPILHSLKLYTDAEKVEVVVCNVVVSQFNLKELVLNEIHLCD